MQISHAEGSYIYDQNKKSYLDFVAGVSACSLGHKHPKVVSAIKMQLDFRRNSPEIIFKNHF